MAFPILEEWRVVPDFDNYMVSSHGRVARVLADRISSTGYPRATLCQDGRRRDVLKHRLVLETFVGPCPQGMEACHHPDNDRTNARLDNLRWDTPSANSCDKVAAGTHNRGTNHPRAKFNETDIERMFDLRRMGCKLQKIAKHMNTDQSYVSQILRGEYWSHLSEGA